MNPRQILDYIAALVANTLLPSLKDISLVSSKKAEDSLNRSTEEVKQSIEEASRATERSLEPLQSLQHLETLQNNLSNLGKLESIFAGISQLKGEKGDDGITPTHEEIVELIKPLIPEPIHGNDYILTAKDKKEIAKAIKVPVVEKIIEKQFETIIEKQPIVTNEIKEVAVTDTPKQIVKKLSSLKDEERLDASAIKNLPEKFTQMYGKGVKYLANLLDVNITSPANNEVLKYNSATGKWVNGTGGTGGGHTIQDEGSSLTQRTNLNFVGTGVTVTDGGAGPDSSIVTISAGAYTDEQAQDAVGAMVDSSLTYVDATPLLQRAALTGDVTAAAGSNATTLATVNANVGSFGLAASVSQFTVNAKGLITAAANVAISIASTVISDSTAAGRAMLTAATAAAQTALLSVFVGDSGAGGTKGLVPAPASGDAAANKYLKADGTWATVAGGGGGTPAGSDKQVQYNNSGAFGAEAGFEYDAATNTLSVEKISNAFSIDLLNAQLIGASSISSIDWANRYLIDGTGASIFRWDNTGVYLTSAGNYVNISASLITANRSVLFPDKDGTIAMTSDITGGGLSIGLSMALSQGVIT